MIEFVKTSSLKAGDVLSKNIYSDDFRILLSAGHTISDKSIEQIRKFGFKGCYIEHEGMRRENIPISEPVLDDTYRIDLIKQIKAIFENQEPFLDPLCTSFRLQRQKMEESVKQLVDRIYDLNNRDAFLYETEDYTRTIKNWIYHHSLNTCIITIGICYHAGLTKDKAKDIALGAVLHDYGKARFGEAFYNKEDLSDEERQQMRKHPEILFRILQRLNYPVDTSYAVWQHHEKIHGNGYPLGLSSEKIIIGAQIVALASAFDNLVTMQAYNRRPMKQYDALEYLLGCDCYSIECVRALLEFIVPYPVGSKVILSNGETGYVLKNVKGCIMRPYVIVGNRLYDLAADFSKMSITILKCLE